MNAPLRIHAWKPGRKEPAPHVSEVEEAAINTVARAISTTNKQAHMARALLRLAGNALAKIGGHDEAARHHADRARYHHERIGKRR